MYICRVGIHFITYTIGTAGRFVLGRHVTRRGGIKSVEISEVKFDKGKVESEIKHENIAKNNF